MIASTILVLSLTLIIQNPKKVFGMVGLFRVSSVPCVAWSK